MYDERVSQEDMDRVYEQGYKKGYEDGVESAKTKMIKEIRKWINSGNRGTADYFIVDMIEETINKYE